MKATDVLTGFPGHPTHPPLTDAAIGLYTGATAFAVLSALGVSQENLAIAWWIALVAGLVVTGPTAITGLLDWLKITRGTPLWRTTTLHLVAMLAATIVFVVAAVVGHGGYVDREVTTAGLLLTLAGFGVMSAGGWLGGTVVFVHGMRVLREQQKPTHEAVKPDAGHDGDAPRAGLTRPGAAPDVRDG